MSEIQTDRTQPSDFARALNSMMDNLENVVVNFQKTLLIALEKIEKLESSEKFYRSHIVSNKKEPSTEGVKQRANDVTTSEPPHQEPSETHDETKMTTNTETNIQQTESKIQGSVPATVKERNIFTGTFSKIIKKLSSKSNYCILAIALAILGIIIVKLYFMLFS